MSSESRVCLQCAGRISSLRRSGTKFCSKTCGALDKRNGSRAGKELSLSKRAVTAKRKGQFLLHSCIPGGGAGLDPFDSDRCKCRKLLTERQATALVARGEAVDFDTRTEVFNERSLVLIGKLLRTPRSATCERPHVERLVETGSAIKAKRKYSEKQLREMHDAVELDKREKAYEQDYRLEHYNDLTLEARRTWIREVPAEEYDAAKRRDWGRALFTNYKEGRTAGGIGVDVDRILGETENADRAA